MNLIIYQSLTATVLTLSLAEAHESWFRTVTVAVPRVETCVVPGGRLLGYLVYSESIPNFQEIFVFHV